jgi:hypothetical protein
MNPVCSLYGRDRNHADNADTRCNGNGSGEIAFPCPVVQSRLGILFNLL